jgi:EpsD family peptidyl-prolyl cis-trans isomerase
MLVHKAAITAGLILAPVFLMAGCGDKEAGGGLKTAALVNGKVVAAEQVEAELAKLGQIPAEQRQNIANRILQNVVDQELLAQQAAQAKLEGQADIQMKIAAARRQILAEAQIAALTKDDGAPAEAEIKAYFDGHPELFGKRRIYKLQELIANTTPENSATVRELASTAKGPRELAAALEAKGIPVAARALVKAAEELPTELLAKLSEMKPGQSLTSIKGGKLNLVILAEAEDKPVGYEQAAPAIMRYLTNMKKRERLAAALKSLKTQAKIEYTAPYGDIAPADSSPEKQ